MAARSPPCSAATARRSPRSSASTAPRRCSPPATSATRCPGVAIASAIAESGQTPDLFLLGTTYEGRDVAARLSVKLDKPVLTNNIEVEVDGDTVIATTPIFGGTQLVRTKFTGGGPHLVLVRPKSFAAEPSGGGAAAVEQLAVPDLGAAGAAKILDRHVEEATGPKLDEAAIVVSGGRGLGEAGKYEMIEQLAKLLKARAGRSPVRSSTPAGCRTRTRSARPARS